MSWKKWIWIRLDCRVIFAQLSLPEWCVSAGAGALFGNLLFPSFFSFGYGLSYICQATGIADCMGPGAR